MNTLTKFTSYLQITTQDQYPFSNKARKLVQVLALLSAVISLLEVVIFLVVSPTQISIFSILVFITSIACFGLTFTGIIRLPYWIMFGIINLSVFMGTCLFGWSGGTIYYLFDLLPIILFLSLKKWEKRVAMLMLALSFIISLGIAQFNEPIIYMAPIRLEFVNFVNAILAFFSMIALLYVYHTTNQRSEQSLVNANKELMLMARKDPLTNLLNRRSILEYIENESQRGSEAGMRAGLIMADIDDYKNVNDNFGHPFGDAVLVQLGSLLQENLRKQDLVARWGGEEFLIYLPGMDQEGLKSVMNKLRMLLRVHVFVAEKDQVTISLTLGGATFNPEESVDSCIKRVDRAMYYGKGKGKDQAVIDLDGELKIIS